MAYWMGCLDLRGQSVPDTLLTAVSAKALWPQAKARGAMRASLTQAATRFNRFWICGQWVEYPKTFRALATMPGETVLITVRPSDHHH